MRKCVALLLLVMLTNACWVGPARYVAAGVYNARGIACYNKRDYDCAIREYSKAIDLSPKFTAALNHRGVAYELKGDYDRAIQDYSEAIRLQPANVLALNNRARTYADKGDYDRSIQDYDTLLALRPKYAEGLHFRGTVYAAKGEPERAIQDYDAAIHLKPDLWNAYYSRGLSRFNLAQFSGARDDFSSAAPKLQDAYSAIWLYLAAGRAGQRDTAELKKNADEIDSSLWPVPVIQFYLGAISVEQLFLAAHNPDSKKQAEQTCEAHFYFGENVLLRGKKSDASRELQQASATCPPTFIEYTAARAELARLNLTPSTAAKQGKAAHP